MHPANSFRTSSTVPMYRVNMNPQRHKTMDKPVPIKLANFINQLADGTLTVAHIPQRFFGE